jgi:hypothetical protein
MNDGPRFPFVSTFGRKSETNDEENGFWDTAVVKLLDIKESKMIDENLLKRIKPMVKE